MFFFVFAPKKPAQMTPYKLPKGFGNGASGRFPHNYVLLSRKHSKNIEKCMRKESGEIREAKAESGNV